MVGSSHRRTVRAAICLMFAAGGAGVAAGPNAVAGPPPGGEEKIPATTVPSEYQWGGNGTGPGQFLDITGLTLGPDGNAYVADCDLDRVQVVTLEGDFVRQIGGPEAPAGALRCPRDLAVAPDGQRVWVLDSANGRVLEYNREGSLVRTVVTDDTLADAWGLATDGELMVVSDPGTESVRFYEHGRPLSRCASSGPPPSRFARPLGVSLDPRGRAYVADQQNHRVARLKADCTVELTFGRYGSLAGELAEPADVEFADGRVFVADMTNHRLQAFDAGGGFLHQWGRHPSTAHEGHGRTHYPSFIATDSAARRAVVCEPFENRCQTFDLLEVQRYISRADDDAFWNKFPKFHYGSKTGSADMPPKDGRDGFFGAFIAEPDLSQVVILDWAGPKPKVRATVGGFGTEPGKLRQPTGVAFSPETAELYVSDGNNHRIQVFDLDGELLRWWGSFGLGTTEMNGPSGLDFDDQGNLLVAMAYGNRVDVFTPEGTLLRSFGEKGTGPGQFNLPTSVRYNPRLGRIYVMDSYNQRVQYFDANGRYLGEFGGNGFDPGQIINAIDLAIDDHDHVYVPDAALNRVQKFDADGRFVRQWGSFGSEVGQFYKPKGAAVLRDRLLVIDFGNHRGQVFDLDGKPLGVFGEGILSPVADTPSIFETVNVSRPAFTSHPHGRPHGAVVFGTAAFVTLAVVWFVQIRSKRRAAA